MTRSEGRKRKINNRMMKVRDRRRGKLGRKEKRCNDRENRSK
jgi:hypothetical protein